MNDTKLLVASITLTIFCVVTTYGTPPRDPVPLAILGLLAGFGALATFLTWAFRR